MVKKLHFLDGSNRALQSVQDKLEGLSYFFSGMVLSHDIDSILETGLAKFNEIVNTKVCSVFLLEEGGFEFFHKMSIPDRFSSLVQKEVDAHIDSGTFGWVINKGLPTCVPSEVFREAKNRAFNTMLAPISNRHRTIGVAVIVFEEDRDFIRQQNQRLLHILSSFFSLSLENAYLFSDLRSSYFDTIRAVTNSIEARDPYTRGHSSRVAQIAQSVAEELDWTKAELELIDWGGMLHDVGKIGVPDAVLNKPGKLTSEEYEMVKSHSLIGADIVKGVSFLEPVVPYILEHHERFDGKGYPQGLVGKNISIKGRLLAVADAFDAMTSDRPYRKGFDPEYAFEEIRRNANTQFDPEIVAAFEGSWSSGKEVYQIPQAKRTHNVLV
ncbi:MAG: HD domain-containing protein [Deltaproteobacteria bacterium]|nr:HD domain-containing protein [Deltaproteobacteria bacterium]